MGYSMQNSIGLSNVINNVTGLAQMGSSMQNAFGLTPDINNVSPGGDNWGFSFPWYSSGISFSSSGFNISSGVSGSHDLSSAFSFFRGF
jgi:hypothetical protein